MKKRNGQVLRNHCRVQSFLLGALILLHLELHRLLHHAPADPHSVLLAVQRGVVVAPPDRVDGGAGGEVGEQVQPAEVGREGGERAGGVAGARARGAAWPRRRIARPLLKL